MFVDLNLMKTAPYIIYLPSKNIFNLFYKNKLKCVIISYANSQPLPILILNVWMPKSL